MIISHRLKFAFFRPPKTGTTSTSFYLRICGAFDDNDTLSGIPTHGLKPTKNLSRKNNGIDIVTQAHYTPAEAVDAGFITIEQLREYKSVAFLRDPFRRTLSAIIHQSGRFCDPSFIKHYITNYTELINKNGLLNSSQSDWFYIEEELVLEPLAMDDYENELRSLIKYVGGIDFPLLPPLNARPRVIAEYPMEEWMSPEFIAFVKDRYSKDIMLYEQVKLEKMEKLV